MARVRADMEKLVGYESADVSLSNWCLLRASLLPPFRLSAESKEKKVFDVCILPKYTGKRRDLMRGREQARQPILSKLMV